MQKRAWEKYKRNMLSELREHSNVHRPFVSNIIGQRSPGPSSRIGRMHAAMDLKWSEAASAKQGAGAELSVDEFAQCEYQRSVYSPPGRSPNPNPAIDDGFVAAGGGRSLDGRLGSCCGGSSSRRSVDCSRRSVDSQSPRAAAPAPEEAAAERPALARLRSKLRQAMPERDPRRDDSPALAVLARALPSILGCKSAMKRGSEPSEAISLGGPPPSILSKPRAAPAPPRKSLDMPSPRKKSLDSPTPSPRKSLGDILPSPRKSLGGTPTEAPAAKPRARVTLYDDRPSKKRTSAVRGPKKTIADIAVTQAVVEHGMSNLVDSATWLRKRVAQGAGTVG